MLTWANIRTGVVKTRLAGPFVKLAKSLQQPLIGQSGAPMSEHALTSSRACNVLAVNVGSSSIKFAVFDSDGARYVSGTIDRVGESGPVLRVAGTEIALGITARTDLGAELLDWLDTQGHLARVEAVGHRIVHGGPAHVEPELLIDTVVADLRRLAPIDPEHLPGELALIEAITRRRPDLPQVACYDTAFHRTLPRIARLLPIPRRYEASGVRRYGFHGLSFAYLMEELDRIGGPGEARGRVILAHLGSGASMAAVWAGACIDTTMGFTPTGGLVMGTRTGDLDPGILIHLMRSEGLNADQLDDLVNRRSGLLGVSESSSDVRDLLARAGTDVRAAESVELFCYQARKWIGALAAVLGGVETLVFAGGIGENAAEIRSRICDGLGFLGVQLNRAGNTAGVSTISEVGSPCRVRIIRTDEEVMIARTVRRVLNFPIGPRNG
jgi:acetate kinase